MHYQNKMHVVIKWNVFHYGQIQSIALGNNWLNKYKMGMNGQRDKWDQRWQWVTEEHVSAMLHGCKKSKYHPQKGSIERLCSDGVLSSVWSIISGYARNQMVREQRKTGRVPWAWETLKGPGSSPPTNEKTVERHDNGLQMCKRRLHRDQTVVDLNYNKGRTRLISAKNDLVIHVLRMEDELDVF